MASKILLHSRIPQCRGNFSNQINRISTTPYWHLQVSKETILFRFIGSPFLEGQFLFTLIHLADPGHYCHTCSVRPFIRPSLRPHFKYQAKQSSLQVIINYCYYCRDCGLAKWIIDDPSLSFFTLPRSVEGEKDFLFSLDNANKFLLFLPNQKYPPLQKSHLTQILSTWLRWQKVFLAFNSFFNLSSVFDG